MNNDDDEQVDFRAVEQSMPVDTEMMVEMLRAVPGTAPFVAEIRDVARREVLRAQLNAPRTPGRAARS